MDDNGIDISHIQPRGRANVTYCFTNTEWLKDVERRLGLIANLIEDVLSVTLPADHPLVYRNLHTLDEINTKYRSQVDGQ